MTNKRIKWGILGSSPISEVMAQAINESSSSQLQAIGSRSLATAKQFAATYLIPEYYDNYQTLLDSDLDAVYIGLPNHLHLEWISRCAQAGKHVLCEKPFVIDCEEAYRALDTIESTQVFAMEALMYRCHPFTQKLWELIHHKIIGDVHLYNATYTANIAQIENPTAGGCILNLGCYPVSLIRMLENAEPVEIKATGRLNPETQIDNQASAILKFPSGAIATVSTANDLEMFWQFDIYGTEGCLKVITNPWLPSHDNKCMIYRNDEKNPIEVRVTAEKSLYTYQIDTVNNHIINQNYTSPEAISLNDSMGNIMVLDAWRQQIKCRKPKSCYVTS